MRRQTTRFNARNTLTDHIQRALQRAITRLKHPLSNAIRIEIALDILRPVPFHPSSTPSPTHIPPADTSFRTQALEALRAEKYSLCASLLNQNESFPLTPPNIVILKRLYPVEAPFQIITPTTLPIQISENTLKRAIHESAKKDVAPGPSRISYKNLASIIAEPLALHFPSEDVIYRYNSSPYLFFDNIAVKKNSTSRPRTNDIKGSL
jgi:hypothetical protein